MKKKVYLYLTGGLGNQLFQYAAAKNIAIKNKSVFLIDKSTGFLDDFRFKRSFSLKKKILKNIIIKNIIIFFIFFRLLKKILNLKKVLYKFFSVTIINEFVYHKFFLPHLENINFNGSLYIMGLFQSEKYFLNNRLEIINDIMPKKPSNKIFYDVHDMISDNSVAIGVRMHEGLPIHLKYTAGGITSHKFYLKGIQILLNKIKNPSFYFFSTKKIYIERLILDLGIINKFKINIITPDNGYCDAYDNLWLMSCFKNLIISNSTLYWWAAYFSKLKFKKNIIICSDRFPNKDTIPKGWIKIKS
jgi:hypothetical protein